MAQHPTPTPTEDLADLSAGALLRAARRERRTADAAEARLLSIAAAWADRHPPESIHSAASFTQPGLEHEEPVAGEGCPAVAFSGSNRQCPS